MKKVVKLFNLFLIIIVIILSSSCKKQKLDIETLNYVVDAKSYIVMDQISGRVLEGGNINKRILPASTTKILTCLTTLNYFDINSYLVITKEMIDIDGSKIYLEVGDIIRVKDLLYGLMLNSGNDAGRALAIGLAGSVDNFVYLMNEECKRIGMVNSTFENPTGLDENSKNYTTAYDMALLMKDALNNQTFRQITKTKEYQAKLLNDKKLYFSNKHKLVHTNDYVTGGKTGYTKQAGRTLITSYRQKDFEIVVATFDCSNDWIIHNELAKSTFNSFVQTNLVNKFEVIKTTKINKFDKKLLLFPLEINEEKEEFSLKYEKMENVVYLNYYQNNERIAQVKIKEND